MSPRRLPTCPVCRSGIDQDLLPGELLCPACGARLQPSTSYFRALFVISLCVCFLGLRAMGIEARYLFYGTIIGVWPAFLVVAALNAMLFPVELEPSTSAVVTPASPNRRPLEGVALRAGAWVLAITTAYLLFEPALGRVSPWVPPRESPAAFPIRIDRAADGFVVESVSDRTWTCTIRVGHGSERRATLRIGSSSRQHVTFDAFGAGAGEPNVPPPRALATEAMSADCTDARGRAVSRSF